MSRTESTEIETTFVRLVSEAKRQRVGLVFEYFEVLGDQFSEQMKTVLREKLRSTVEEVLKIIKTSL
jgi:hypothetical protein